MRGYLKLNFPDSRVKIAKLRAGIPRASASARSEIRAFTLATVQLVTELSFYICSCAGRKLVTPKDVARALTIVGKRFYGLP